MLHVNGGTECLSLAWGGGCHFQGSETIKRLSMLSLHTSSTPHCCHGETNAKDNASQAHTSRVDSRLQVKLKVVVNLPHHATAQATKVRTEACKRPAIDKAEKKERVLCSALCRFV